MRIRIAFATAALVIAAIAQAGPTQAAAPGGGAAYLVATDRPLTAQQIAEIQSTGAIVKYAYRNFGGAAVVAGQRAAAQIAVLPFVTAVNPDTVKQPDTVFVDAAYRPTADTTLPGGSIPYWQDLIDAENDTTYDGTGVYVFGLDTGFYKYWREYFKESSIDTSLATAFVAALGNPNENQWDVGSDPHGMATAATVVGYYLKDRPGEGAFGDGYATGAAGTYWVPGVASGATFVPIKVCEPIGCFGSSINAAVDYVMDFKNDNPGTPVVINESLGGSTLDATEKAAIDAAVSAGVVMVASAGNSGNAGMGYPAAYEPVVSVGAGGWRDQWNGWPDNTWWLDNVDEDGVDEVFVVNFSSRERQPTSGPYAGQTRQYLDIVSTGRNMLLPYPCAKLYKDGQVTNGTAHRTCASKAAPDNMNTALFQYLYISGTSFSSPTIAGVVARMLDKVPGKSNSTAVPAGSDIDDGSTWGSGGEVEGILESTATDIPANSLMIGQRNGATALECWETASEPPGYPATYCQDWEATGYGWVFVDDALAGTTP